MSHVRLAFKLFHQHSLSSVQPETAVPHYVLVTINCSSCLLFFNQGSVVLSIQKNLCLLSEENRKQELPFKKANLLRWIHIHLRFLFIEFVSVNNHRVPFFDPDTLFECLIHQLKLALLIDFLCLEMTQVRLVRLVQECNL